MENAWKITIDGSLSIWLIMAAYHSYMVICIGVYMWYSLYCTWCCAGDHIWKLEMNFGKDDNLWHKALHAMFFISIKPIEWSCCTFFLYKYLLRNLLKTVLPSINVIQMCMNQSSLYIVQSYVSWFNFVEDLIILCVWYKQTPVSPIRYSLYSSTHTLGVNTSTLWYKYENVSFYRPHISKL
jgi:hypothetical protein